MAKEKILVVKPGQKLKHKRKNTIYMVKSVKDGTVTLISEDGRASMLIQMDDLIGGGFELVYD